MQSALEIAVARNLFMTRQAETGLSGSGESLVAVLAIGLKVCVGLREFARRYEFLENVLGARAPDDCENDQRRRQIPELAIGSHRASLIKMDGDHVEDRGYHQQEKERHVKHMPRGKGPLIDAKTRGLVDRREIN